MVRYIRGVKNKGKEGSNEAFDILVHTYLL